MSRILIIGDYYPYCSYNSILNKLLVERLKKEGHEAILLSDSWCAVHNKNEIYGDVITLSENYPFEKRFYLDPIQVQFSGNNILLSYLGLACKIINNQKIDLILYMSDIRNSLLVELITSRYSIKAIMINFDINIYKFLDNYTYPSMTANLMNYAEIYTFRPNIYMLERFLKIPKSKMRDLEECFIENKVPNNSDIEQICVLDTILDDKRYALIKSRIHELENKYKILIVPMKNNAHNQCGTIPFENFISVNTPKTALTTANEVLDDRNYVAFSEITLSFNLGYPFLIRNSRITQINEFYASNYVGVSTEWSILNAIHEVHKS